MTPAKARSAACLAAVSLLVAAAAPAQEVAAPRLKLGGDFRVRYEGNSAIGSGTERHRGVLRFRIGASWEVNDWLSVGGRAVSGDASDPRTADVTMGRFLDDLEVSLDRAYLELKLDRGFATAGKLPHPFATTELIWDGDVNPAGAAGSLELGRIGGFTPHLGTMFMVVDERSAASDGTMWGVQARLARGGGERWGFEVAATYADYSIPSLANADPGDRRGNYIAADGARYRSDFDLASLMVSLTSPGQSYPVRVVIDFVRNLGAVVDEDEGFGIDVYVGRAWVRRALQLQLGYAECETDAVLGAFSHDNLPLATNYRNHTLRASYGLLEDTALSLTWYYFERLRAAAGTVDDGFGRASSRVRLDVMVRF